MTSKTARTALCVIAGLLLISGRGTGAQETAGALGSGDLTLLVEPEYRAAVDDEIRTLMHIGLAPYATPSLSLVESDRLQLVLTYADYTTAVVALPYRDAVWVPGDELELRVLWRLTGSEPFFALLIDGQLVGLQQADLVPQFDSPSARIFFGEQWDGIFPFPGELEVTSLRDRPALTPLALDGLPVYETGIVPGSDPAPVARSSSGAGADGGEVAGGESGAVPVGPPVRTGGELNPPHVFEGAGIEDRSPPPRVTLGRPAPGLRVVMPGYGTALRRLTAASDDGGFATQIYSQLQAFSPDGRFILVTSDTGYRVLDLADGGDMSIDSRGWNAPRWNPTADHEILTFDANDDTSLALMGIDAEEGSVRTVFQFPGRYERIRPAQSFDEVSRDGRWIAGLASFADGEQAIFTLDVSRGRLGAEIPLAVLYGESEAAAPDDEAIQGAAAGLRRIAGRCRPDPQYGVLEPDWIGVTAGGSALVVQWVRDWAPGVGGCSGLEALDIETGAYLGRISNGHAHGDLGLLRDGTEVFYTVALASPEDPNRPAVVYHEVPLAVTMDPSEGARASVFLLTIPWGAAQHLSAQGPPGMVLIGSGAYDPSSRSLSEHPREAFLQELVLVFSDGSFRRLGQTRTSACGYWAQARATLSPDGRYVAFASDWYAETGQTGCDARTMGSADLYLLEIR